ncbi:hypothetical protein FS842_009789 [Serendipita sp. 407]|nr:hypothetical protein FS842_009789 [Serendipita sp. 407]
MSKVTQKAHGFIELSPGHDPIVDIVAIHGLDGHREQSWTAEDGTMWLKDLLPDDISNVRILSYGYDADTRNFSRTSTQNIFRHAEAFAEDLSRSRKAADPKVETDYILGTQPGWNHSQKGPSIVVQEYPESRLTANKALAHCHGADFETGHHLRDISTSTFAILFFGTPHGGANGVQLAEWMGRVLSMCMSTNDRMLKALNRDSSELEDIQKVYLPVGRRINTIFFYEEYATPIVRGMKELIVPRHLAVIQGDSRARVVVLHADHCEMVKYSGRNDVNYKKVVDYIAELVRNATATVKENWMRENAYRAVANAEPIPSSQIVLPKPRLPVSRNYVQRQYIYDFITEKLLPLMPTEHQPRCILHGLGGGGKTQVASCWIERHTDRFSRIVVVDASNEQQIQADLETAIRSIGPQHSKATWKDTISYLSVEKEWLLFLDNADQPDLRLDRYLPNSIYGAVLVTTRNRDCVMYAQDSHIQVEKMVESEAVDLLHSVAKVAPSSNNASVAIVRELGMWALAITQAGAYIFRTRRLDKYLATLQKHRDKLMREASLQGMNYERSIYAAFDLSFGLLSRKAQEFMKICAFLHHSSIPHALFERSVSCGFHTYTAWKSCPPPSSDEEIISSLKVIFGSEWDDLLFQALIDSIAQGSLIDTSTESNGQCFYNVHPLVQTYIRDSLGQDDRERYSLSAGQILLGAVRPLESESNAWHRQLLAHVDQLPAEVKMSHPSHSLAFLMVSESTGSWNLSQMLEEYCHSEFGRVLGPRHPDTVSVMINLAITLYDRGQLEEAETMWREVLALQTEILGPRHPHTVWVMNNLASTLYDGGQQEEAEPILREILALLTEILGPQHPHTVMVVINLANTLNGRGQLEEAETMGREALALQTKILGPRHPHTVGTMVNLAITLCHRGQLEQAERMTLEATALLQEILGPQSSHTVSSMSILSSIRLERERLVGMTKNPCDRV